MVLVRVFKLFDNSQHSNKMYLYTTCTSEQVSCLCLRFLTGQTVQSKVRMYPRTVLTGQSITITSYLCTFSAYIFCYISSQRIYKSLIGSKIQKSWCKQLNLPDFSGQNYSTSFRHIPPLTFLQQCCSPSYK